MFLNKEFLNIYEELSDLNESKADTQRLINFAGEDLANRFLKLKNRLKTPENDLYYWIKNKSPEELEQTINNLEDTKTATQAKKETTGHGAKLVCDTKHWRVYHITTYEAAQAYGRDTHWCITGINKWGDTYWRDYKNKGADFYFFITKGMYDPRGQNSKYALAVYPNNECEVFDQKDGQVSLYDIKYIYEVSIPGIDLDSLTDRGWECFNCGVFVPQDLIVLGPENSNAYCEKCWDKLFK